MRKQPTPAQLFLYGLIVTLLVFVARCRSALLLLALINGVPGFIVGARRYPLITALFVFGVIGTFLNSLLVVNTGEPVFSIGGLVVRSDAVNATVNITLRFFTLGGVSFIYVSMITPREAIKSLERELGLPKGIAFAVALSLRLLRLSQVDLAEISAMRRQRGARRIPLTPSDYESLILPSLSIMLERARWIGISAELRGFSLRPPSRRQFVPTLGGFFLLILTLFQVLGIVACTGLL